MAGELTNDEKLEVLEDELVFIHEITVMLNDAREKIGRPPVTERWVVEIARERAVREEVGHPFLPVYKFNARLHGRAKYFGFRSEIKKHIDDVAALDKQVESEVGNKFLQNQRRLKQRTVLVQGNSEALKPDPARMAQVKSLDAAMLVELIRGGQTCPFCDGGGQNCGYCVGGIILFDAPRYTDGLLVRQRDIVELLIQIPGYADADRGMVLSWSKDSTVVTIALIRGEKPLKKAAQVRLSEIRLIQRSPV